jgi:hypothetical protein
MKLILECDWRVAAPTGSVLHPPEKETVGVLLYPEPTLVTYTPPTPLKPFPEIPVIAAQL